MKNQQTQKIFFSLLLFLQIVFIIIYGVWFKYDETFDETYNEGDQEIIDSRVDRYYFYYTNIALFVLVGFGFIRSFLRFYGYSSVGYTLFLTAFCLQFGIILKVFWDQLHDGNFMKHSLTIDDLIEGLYCASTVLISFGVILGRTTPFQMLMIAFCELILYSFNYYFSIVLAEGIDLGRSMTVHTFGSFFGFAISVFLRQHNGTLQNEKYISDSYSEMFTWIGTLIMWVMFPSFNTALATPQSSYRSIINTLLAICSSCCASFLLSPFFNKGKFNVIDIQGATLAGGIAIGSSANLCVSLYGAMIIGFAGGLFSIIGYEILSKQLKNRFNVQDSCRIMNLHGIPGIIGGIASIVTTHFGTKDHDLYDGEFERIFPRSDNQTKSQAACFIMSFVISLFGGCIIGLLIYLMKIKPDKPFDDSEFWNDGSDSKSKQGDIDTDTNRSSTFSDYSTTKRSTFDVEDKNGKINISNSSDFSSDNV
ncbi:rh50 [Anaeramoeba flamelloides]|uniref:Rh50 n=1 Tax=Anaeramoeba flamelloides TaxID=1746091 RepID=A0ABQ8XPH0_9EUKA|nr:rh50 [Anaeramoeba flamelloides]